LFGASDGSSASPSSKVTASVAALAGAPLPPLAAAADG